MAAPVLTSLDINAGPSGTIVTITGTGFDDTVSAVHFGTATCGTNWEMLADDTVVAYAPHGTGAVSVKVTNSSGQSNGLTFTYDDDEGGGTTPSITQNVNPQTSASTDGSGGDSVAIVGAGFSTATGVYFGNASASFVINSDTSITAIAPASPFGTVDITVVNPYGTSANTSYDNFTYPAPSLPTVTSVTPSSGLAGTLVQIGGTNFLTANAVLFYLASHHGGGGESWYPAFEVVDEYTIECRTPVGPDNGEYPDIYVTNEYGVSTTHVHFTYGARLGPTTTATNLQTASGINWTLGPVNVTLTASDDVATAGDNLGPGISKTFYKLDDGSVTVYSSAVAVSTAGTHRFEYWSVSVDGTTEPGKVGWVNIATDISSPSQAWKDSFTATAKEGAVYCSWNALSAVQPLLYAVYSDSNSPPTTVVGSTGNLHYTVLIPHALGARNYAVKAYDTVPQTSALSTVRSQTAGETSADIIADDSINAMKMFAAGIAPIHVVTELPSPTNADYEYGSMVFLTTDMKLYRKVAASPNTNTGTNKAAWNDLSSSNNDGTLSGFDWSETSGWDGTGWQGDAYNLCFDGTDTRVAMGTAVAPATARVFSIEAWVRSNTTSGTTCIFFTGESGTSNNYYNLMVSSSGRPVCGYRAAGGTIYTCNSQTIATVADGGFHHVVGTWSSTGPTMTLYVDGVLQESKTVDTSTVTITATSLGRTEYASPSAYYNGGIARVRVYDATLTQDEVTAHYQMGPFGLGYKTSPKLDLSAEQAQAVDAWLPAITAVGSVISGDQIIGNSIKAGMIAAGAIGVDEIAAQKVLAKHVTIGNFDNLMPNPMSEWDTTGRNTYPTDLNPDLDFRGVSTTAKYTGYRGRYIVGAGATVEASYVITPFIAAIPGERYYLEAYGKLTSTTNNPKATIRLRPYYMNSSTLTLMPSSYFRDIGDVNTTGWVKYVMSDEETPPHAYYTLPSIAAGDTYDTVGFDLQVFTDTLGTTQYAYFDEIFLRQATDGRLIVDGAIDGKFIQGPTIRTAVETDPYNPVKKRVELREGTESDPDGDVDKILWYPYDSCADADAAYIGTGTTGSNANPWLKFMGPKAGDEQGYITMEAIDGSPDVSLMQVNATKLKLGRGYPGDNPYEAVSNTISLGGVVNIGPSRYAGISNQHEFLRPVAAYQATSGDPVYVDDWQLNRMTTNGYDAISVSNDTMHHPGVLRLGCNAYVGSGCHMRTALNALRIIDSADVASPRDDSNDYDYAEFCFRIVETTDTRVRMGFMNTGNLFNGGAPTSGDYGAWVYIDGTSMRGYTCNNGSTSYTDPVTITEGAWYTAKILFDSSAGKTYFWGYNAGGTNPRLKFFDPTGNGISYTPVDQDMGHGFAVWTTGTTEQAIFDIDYMNYYLAPRDR